jgi:hypothetical protein
MVLLDLFADYNFVTPSDLTRAVAHSLSATLKLGNLLGDANYPMDIGLGNVSQVGKSRRMRINAAVHGEVAYAFTKHEGSGVGGTNEAAGAALTSGKLFVLIDNVRKEFDNQFIESVLRGTQMISVRIPYHEPLQVEANRSLWQMTSNNAEITPDLANRSVIVNINEPAKLKAGEQRKSSAGWDDATFVYISENQGMYLAAVHTIVGAWILAGKPRTNEVRHTFTAWTQSLDYITNEMLGLPKLMHHHQAAYLALSNQKFGWLRQVVIEAVKKHADILLKNPDATLTLAATDFGELSEDNGITIPGLRSSSGIKDVMEVARQIGNVMKEIFKESDEVEVERYTVTRIETTTTGSHHPTKQYVVRLRK